MSANTIKNIAPFLDPHLLLYFLQKNTGKDTGVTAGLQSQIKGKLLIGQKDNAAKLEKQGKDAAKNLLDVLNGPDKQQLREQHRFTLEALSKERGITLDDCIALQSYAKIIYEQGKYKEAEKLLFSLKEILVNEAQTHPDLVFQVFWGLLACEILNDKDRDVVEHTSLKKMREIIERKYGADGIRSSSSSQEHIETATWLLHWLLVYSFTNNDLTNAGLFATILTDTSLYGSHFLNIVQMRADSLAKYMITSFLLVRAQPNAKYQIDRDALENLALPIALDQLKANDIAGKTNSCSFSRFLKAVYEDYDLDAAIGIVDEMHAEANDDLLLHKYALDIKHHAYLLIFQMKIKLYKSVAIDELKKYTGDQLDNAIAEIERYLSADGFAVTVDDKKKSISCMLAQPQTVEEAMQAKAIDLYKKTQELNKQYLVQKEKVDKSKVK